MDVTRAPQINTPESAPRSRVTEATEAEEKAQAMRNAVAQLQARYGEKPKEARPIKKTLDKDDFLRIMISEMKHQDPTKPMDADKMASQMAQLTSVEQLKNMGTAIEKLADKNQASDRLAMSGMIGKTVTVDKGRFTHQKGTLSAVNFELPQDAEKITLKFLDERGEEVASRELEPMKAGPNVYNWDGINASSIPTASGSYLVRVDAETKEGAKIQVNPISQETVIGVSFEGGEANFLVGDTKSPQKVAFRNVTRIEADRGVQGSVAQRKAEQAQSMQAANAADGAQAAGSNQPFALPTELQEKFKNDLAANESEPVKAEGFPSGLSEGSSSEAVARE
jgi:flagellar basal-body rod modification protein FlgD